jgi:hypothetical protein
MPSMGEMMAMSTANVHISMSVCMKSTSLQQKGVWGKRCSPHQHVSVDIYNSVLVTSSALWCDHVQVARPKFTDHKTRTSHSYRLTSFGTSEFTDPAAWIRMSTSGCRQSTLRTLSVRLTRPTHGQRRHAVRFGSVHLAWYEEALSRRVDAHTDTGRLCQEGLPRTWQHTGGNVHTLVQNWPHLQLRKRYRTRRPPTAWTWRWQQVCLAMRVKHQRSLVTGMATSVCLRVQGFARQLT